MTIYVVGVVVVGIINIKVYPQQYYYHDTSTTVSKEIVFKSTGLTIKKCTNTKKLAFMFGNIIHEQYTQPSIDWVFTQHFDKILSQKFLNLSNILCAVYEKRDPDKAVSNCFAKKFVSTNDNNERLYRLCNITLSI